MTATATAIAAPTVKDQELIPHGLVESASVNSFADFVSSNLNETEANKEKDVNDFINTFICHLIFYAVFCISIVLHILIDLGLGSLVKNQFRRFIEIAKNTFVEKNPALA
ncbi:hypothetical protein [Prochlorococcus sp. MIT 0916]|uniref:hypothetical protein n=1 Tax=Prochlorococcus sp. MIT 0916 TaxID=3082521 RepID=UPI0039B4662C